LKEPALVTKLDDKGSESLTFYYKNMEFGKLFNLIFERSSNGIEGGYLFEYELSNPAILAQINYEIDLLAMQGTRVRVRPLSAFESILSKNQEDCFQIIYDFSTPGSDDEAGSGGGDDGNSTPTIIIGTGTTIRIGGSTTVVGNTNGDTDGTTNTGDGTPSGDTGGGTPPSGGGGNTTPCLDEYQHIIRYNYDGSIRWQGYILTKKCPDIPETFTGGEASDNKDYTSCRKLLEAMGILIRPLGRLPSSVGVELIDLAADNTPYNISALYDFLNVSALDACMSSENTGAGCIQNQVKDYLKSALAVPLSGTPQLVYETVIENIQDDAILADLFHAVYGSNGNEDILVASRYALSNLSDAAIVSDLSGQLLHLAKLSKQLEGSFEQYAPYFSHLINNLCGVLSPRQTDLIIRRPEDIQKMSEFINRENNTPESIDYVDFAIEMIEEDEERKWDRFEELRELVEADPDALIADCPPSIHDWTDLSSFELSGAPLQRIQDSDLWEVHDIAEASGARVNLDYFSIHLEQMPTINGLQVSPEELFEHFRTEINDFADKFTPQSPADLAMWNSSAPLSTILNIRLLAEPITGSALADGDVICAQYEPCCWIFSTLRSSNGLTGGGYHPVSGNRKFGYTFEDGVFVLYTQGADRTTTWYHSLNNSEMAFSAGDEFWREMQAKFKAFAEANGGWTVPNNETSEVSIRPDWAEVKDLLTSPTPITHIPCN
jgi:hypothetical protein